VAGRLAVTACAGHAPSSPQPRCWWAWPGTSRGGRLRPVPGGRRGGGRPRGRVLELVGDWFAEPRASGTGSRRHDHWRGRDRGGMIRLSTSSPWRCVEFVCAA
jgi:hypothetical protein